jgi:hypothetical protein
MLKNPKRQQASPDAKDAGTRGGKRPAPQAIPGLDELLARSKPELVELAAGLGLKGVAKLAKAELAHRVHEASAPAKPAAAKPPPPPAARAPPAPAARPAAPKPSPPPAARPAAAKPPPPPAARPAAAKPSPPPAARPAAAKPPPAPPVRPAGKPAPRSAAPSAPAASPVPVAQPAPVAPPPARQVVVPEPERVPAPAEPVAGATPEPPASGAVPTERPSPAAAARLDLGRPSPASGREEHIPWSYGQDRITAMAVDPGNLYVYWEVTDPAIGKARAALGAAGEGAWLNLRVYDTTGIIFDGGNAHSWFDHGLGRSDRQWFFSINKPSSSVIVEIGLRAADGGFARVARSSRVDFPRNGPAPWGDPEWMTVLASGEPVPAGHGAPARPGGDAQVHGGLPPAGAPGGPGGDLRHEHTPVWILLEPGEGERRFRELFGEQFERIEWQSGGGEGWYEFQGRLEWQVGPMVSSWEEGPFPYPVQVEPPTRATWEGGAIAYTQGGVTRVVYGPWGVVIKNLHGHAAQAVLGRWQIYRSWATRGGVEELQQLSSRMAAGAPGGASERVAASGMLWGAGSELRLSGASELWRVGASEVRLRGASEVYYAGASERRMMGASERRMAGASEWRLGGASERQLGGASERVRQGASEWRLGGASERQLAGASERLLRGASEARLGASEQRLGGAGEQRPGEDAARTDDDWDWEPPGSAPVPGRE